MDNRLHELRHYLANYTPRIDAYYLPRTDAHQNKYIRERDNYVKFFSGFSGSEAEILVTKDEAILWTDGRYFIQAELELYDDWDLMKKGLCEMSPIDWLISIMPDRSHIAFDSILMTCEDALKFIDILTKAGFHVTALRKDFFAEIWLDRPLEPTHPISLLHISDHGLDSSSKISTVYSILGKKKCSSAIFTSLEEIAWLLNIRGADIPFTPVVFSIVILAHNGAHLFIDLRKLDEGTRRYLEKYVTIHEYDEAIEWIIDWNTRTSRLNLHKVILVVQVNFFLQVFLPSNINYLLASIIGPENSIIDQSPIQKLKAVKNETELEGMRHANSRDSRVVIEFLHGISTAIGKPNGDKITELSMIEYIDNLRSKAFSFLGLSFATIAAVDDHAALPHYHASAKTGKREVTKDSICLVDSGGHYIDGTTDVTRTFTFSDRVDDEFKHMFTLVLKGHIAAASLVFPKFTNGMRIDMIARQYLWAEGYDFIHGVGHGVGHALNVHEGPVQISYRNYNPCGAIEKGMVLTIEPGFYLEDEWGIRIENCYEVVSAENLRSGSNDYVAFRPLTLVPIQTSLIKKDLLTTSEITWINEYHQKCLHEHSYHFKAENKLDILQWLENACKPI
ncbi:unnamed protein product [Dracunculus medinensis]|uniref:AMP_N domain-containing protein n=1 Tax=Dracunculus medinensis TaxID=318479 RepID=A0A0N4UP58_DRAME|nr:unnamed protein product [Dracunculus medinensis]